MSVIENQWTDLKQYTDARIALGRTGVSLPTSEHLRFQMSHAQARDAVLSTCDFTSLKDEIDTLLTGCRCILLHSAAGSRRKYLQRPDLGRVLSEDSEKDLRESVSSEKEKNHDFSLTIGDGLSALAIERNIIPFLKIFIPKIAESGLKMAAPALVSQCRVACADRVSGIQGSKVSVICIGERPGLSSPDSMGIYLTWSPRPGETKDDKRNCISNIRQGGMGYTEASEKLFYLLNESLRRQISGVDLKDEQGSSLKSAEGISLQE